MPFFENSVIKNEEGKEGGQEKIPPVKEITFYAVEKEGTLFFVWEGSLHSELIIRRTRNFPEEDSGIKYFKRTMFSETLENCALNFFLMQKGSHNLEEREKNKPLYSFKFNLNSNTKKEIEEIYQGKATLRELTPEEKEKILESILKYLQETKEKKELDEKEEESLLISINKAREQIK